MKVIKLIDKWVVRFCRILLLILFAIITFSGFLQVITRFVFESPLTWTDELCRFGMVWITFIGAGYAVKNHAHVAVDIIKGLLPERISKILDKLNSCFILIFAVVLLYYGLVLALSNMDQTSSGLGLSMGLIYASIPIGGLIMIFYSIADILDLNQN